MIIADIITLLKSHTFYGAGEFTEIAKGKNEIGYTLRKIKRLWLSRGTS
jgi:hypothetical protein